MSLYKIFTVVLKVLGIFQIKHVLISLGSVINLFSTSGMISGDSSYLIATFFVVALAFAIELGVCYLLLFKTDLIISKLQLDRELPEEKFSFAIKQSTELKEWAMRPVITVSILLVAVYILVTEVPQFIMKCVNYNDTRLLMQYNDKSGIVLSASYIIIAYVLLKAHKAIVDFIMKHVQDGKEEIIDKEDREQVS